MKSHEKNNFETAIFGGGCFWCLEAVFSKLNGVHAVTSGYAGGTKPNPTYREVCSGETGHAEVTRVEYNPVVISFRDLLGVFFAMHDPTTLNRQGGDVGPQYRSIILHTNANQKIEAEEFIKKLEKEQVFKNKIVTRIEPFKEFYPAENYHQRYFESNTLKPYCQINIPPKVAKLREKFGEMMK